MKTSLFMQFTTNFQVNYIGFCLLVYCNSDDKINYIPRLLKLKKQHCPSLAKHLFCKSQPCTCALIQTWGSENWFMKEGIEFWKSFLLFLGHSVNSLSMLDEGPSLSDWL